QGLTASGRGGDEDVLAGLDRRPSLRLRFGRRCEGCPEPCRDRGVKPGQGAHALRPNASLRHRPPPPGLPTARAAPSPTPPPTGRGTDPQGPSCKKVKMLTPAMVAWWRNPREASSGTLIAVPGIGITQEDDAALDGELVAGKGDVDVEALPLVGNVDRPLPLVGSGRPPPFEDAQAE